MKKIKYLIIGAGISGLTFANYCNGDYLIIEKENEPGGYCRTIRQGGYIWDYAGHFFHFKTEEFKRRFIDSLDESEYVYQNKNTCIYYKGKLIDYPFQMNIHQLDKEEFIDCLYDLFNKEEKESYDNFLDMLYGKFGKSITEKFLKPYNEKLYACDLKILDKDAMGRFFPYADKEAIIKNMKLHANSSYNSYFFYPKAGAEFIINNLMGKIDHNKLMLHTLVETVDEETKTVTLTGGIKVKYEYLINTAPFNSFIRLFNKTKYKYLSDSLTYNKLLVFNLGFDKKSTYDKQHWIYFPDKNINFYRVGFYDNILGTERLSMYIEIGYSKDDVISDDEIRKQLEKTIDNLNKIGIIDESFILEEHVALIMDPSYVHISHETNDEIKSIMSMFNNMNIYSIGRYGGWTYCSMEDCMLEAFTLAEKI